MKVTIIPNIEEKEFPLVKSSLYPNSSLLGKNYLFYIVNFSNYNYIAKLITSIGLEDIFEIPSDTIYGNKDKFTIKINYKDSKIRVDKLLNILKNLEKNDKEIYKYFSLKRKYLLNTTIKSFEIVNEFIDYCKENNYDSIYITYDNDIKVSDGIINRFFIYKKKEVE